MLVQYLTMRRLNSDLRLANSGQVLAGVLQLEAHVREEHTTETVPGRMKNNFKQFIGRAKTTFSKKKVILFLYNTAFVLSWNLSGGLRDVSGRW